MNKKKKLLAILVAILVVGAVGGTSYVLYNVGKNHKKPVIVTKIDLATDLAIQTKLQSILDNNKKTKWNIIALQTEIDNDLSIGAYQITVTEDDKLSSFTVDQTSFTFKGNDLKYVNTKDLVQTYNQINTFIDIDTIQKQLQKLLDDQRQPVKSAKEMQAILDENGYGKDQGIEVGLEGSNNTPVITTFNSDTDYKEGEKIEFTISGLGDNAYPSFEYNKTTKISQENLSCQATGYKFGDEIKYTWNQDLQAMTDGTETATEITQIGFNTKGQVSKMPRNVEQVATTIPKEVISLSSMFFALTSNFNQDLSSWNTLNVIDMNRMFNNAKNSNVNCSKWDTSHVTNMEAMFALASTFTGNLSLWNTSSVENMSSMFYNISNLGGSIAGWDTSKVTNMSSMFYGMKDFNQDISSWDVSSVINMNSMFSQTIAFNQNISKWDVSSVTKMNGMFYGASSFNQDISSWDVAKVNNYDEFATNKSWNEAKRPNFIEI